MRILALTRYDRLGASSRMRFFQYLPYLKRLGIEVTVSPLFSDEYVFRLQQRNRRSRSEALFGLIRRMRCLLNAGGHDLLWIEKEALPWLPLMLERLFLDGAQPYVLDYDDAVFHHYDQHRNPMVRGLLGAKHDGLMRKSRLVMAGNSYLAARALAAGAARVEILPTVVDLDRYPAPSFSSQPAVQPIIGWIGQRHNAHYLELIGKSVHQLHREGKARFLAMGAGDGAQNPFKPVEWTEETETREISRFDVGIMPLPDEPFERGKCGYKLIQYMACGKPVIASPVGVNAEIVEHGVNGLLAETPEEWDCALRRLIGDDTMRRRMGRAGREKVEHLYSLQVTAPHIAALLRDAANADSKQ